MAEKKFVFDDQTEVIPIHGRSPLKRLPGRDLPISDDEGDDDVKSADPPIEIIEETRGAAPRKSSLMVNPISKVQARKRSVTFETVDVASLHKAPSLEDQDEDPADDTGDLDDVPLSPSSSNAKSLPIPIANLRLRVNDDIPDSPPPRGGVDACSEALPPTPPGASHRVKFPRTPPPTPIDTKYL